MKRNQHLLIIAFSLLFSFSGFSQNEFKLELLKKFGGGATDGGVSICTDNNCYIGGGLGVDGLWQYNYEATNWINKGSIGNKNRAWAFGFAIGDEVFIGGGDETGNFDVLDDFYKYSESDDSWMELATFPTGGRDGTWHFALNGKGYVGSGFNGAGIVPDLHEYDPNTDKWSELFSFPGGALIFANAVVVDDVAYVFNGAGQAEHKEVYAFDGTNWEVKKDFPGEARQAAAACTDGKFIYVLGGMAGYQKVFEELWRYDPSKDEWKLLSDDFPALAWSTAYCKDGYLYFGTGATLPNLEYSDAFFRVSLDDLNATSTPELIALPKPIKYYHNRSLRLDRFSHPLTDFTLIDAQGRVQLSRTQLNPSERIDVGHLEAGFYTVHAHSDEGLIQFKFVKSE